MRLQPKLQTVKEATMEKLELRFTYEKETKNTVRISPSALSMCRRRCWESQCHRGLG